MVLPASRILAMHPTADAHLINIVGGRVAGTRAPRYKLVSAWERADGQGEVDRFRDELPLREAKATVLFLDVVQSTSVIALDEAVGVARIRHLLATCCGEVMSRHGGRMVQRMGDGLLLEFDTPRDAIAFAREAHRVARVPSDGEPLLLRIGIHECRVYTDSSAYYGLGLHAAARLTAEALPGETVVSATALDGVKLGLDVDVEDLGECHLRHLQEPMRLFRVLESASVRVGDALQALTAPLPVIAVFPLENRERQEPASIVGEVFADGVIAELSRIRSFRVISRQTTGAIDRMERQQEAVARLRPDYLVRGKYLMRGAGFLFWVELLDARTDEVLWADRLHSSEADLLAAESPLFGTVCAAIVKQLGALALSRSSYLPLRSLSSSELLMAAIALTSRMSPSQYERPREMLEALIERHRASPLPRVWLAHWYVVRRVQGMPPLTDDDGALAMSMASRALDLDPTNAHALAAQGFAAMHFAKDFELARQHLEAAIAQDRSCAWAWLFLGTLNAFQGHGEPAERACAEALACSPLDPMRHYFLTHAAGAAFTNHNYGSAVELAEASLRHNRFHASTLRVLAMSLALGGRLVEARRAGQELLRIDPHLTVAGYLQRAPSARYEVGQRCAEGLRLAGVPQR